MSKSYRRITDSDIKTITGFIRDVETGKLSYELSWKTLEENFSFTRQAMQAKPAIKSAFQSAKQSLRGDEGNKLKATPEDMLKEIERLEKEIEIYKAREQNWKLRWQRIAFHIREKGLAVKDIDKNSLPGSRLPNVNETSKILTILDKDIPLS